MYMYEICMYMLYYLYLLMSVLPNINKASMVGTGYLFESDANTREVQQKL